jgi:hypothetical protein
VDTLTREALQTRIVDGFTGYQAEDEAEVLKQVYSIWSVLQKRGVRYSDISTTAAASQVVMPPTISVVDVLATVSTDAAESEDDPHPARSAADMRATAARPPMREIFMRQRYRPVRPLP